MLNLSILNTDVQKYINKHIGASISHLALETKDMEGVSRHEILNQIEAKTKSRHKIPSWFCNKNILFPNKISIEQSSSEKTAEYKARICSGESLIDITGGMGVDAYYFSRHIKSVIYCEIDSDLAETAKHNFGVLGVSNIICKQGDGLSLLSESTDTIFDISDTKLHNSDTKLHNSDTKLHNSDTKLHNSETICDWIYIDPSRRSEIKGKVFMLKDCLPNVPDNLPLLFSKTNRVLMKTSPLLDISAGINELMYVKRIHIVSIDNEVKELLWELHKNYSGSVEIKTINIKKRGEEIFCFTKGNTQRAVSCSLPRKYLYQPNSSIMKSGGFDEISVVFGLQKLNPNTHLYTSDTIIDFPGRIFEIVNTFPYKKTEMKHNLEGKCCNVSTRNFPETTDDIKRKWKIRDGGEVYSFFITDVNNNKIVLLCAKIK